ncbi:MAG: hypothetical protein MUO54_11090 [Anaerolineales bacterium]|nr:hypothetical protein [Anaerolineales bacterium]
MNLTHSQLEIVESDLTSSIFLSGPAGVGKSTTGINRLTYLVNNGVPGNSILLLFPQRTLSLIYQETINSISFQGGSRPVIATFGGLARRTIELYWPLVVEGSGFSNPSKPPVFLTLESTLFFMSELVSPLIVNEGYFSSVTIQRNRLFSQIIDNLNKAAIHGFPHTKFSERLQSSWIGDPANLSIFQDAQNAANLFRSYCYQHNLLDFSLQVELFVRLLSDNQLVNDHFRQQFKHLIYDNLEEDVPVSHDFIIDLLPSLDSSLLIYDLDAGYRNFLGASPAGGKIFRESVSECVDFTESFIMSHALNHFNSLLSSSLQGQELYDEISPEDISNIVSVNFHPYYPQMVGWVAEQINLLIKNGISPHEIVVLAPFLSDSLRFLLTDELAKYQIQTTSHRPSRALRDEPATHCLLTLAVLAHQDWNIHPTVHELSHALMQTIDNLDLTRSYILSKYALNAPQKSSNLIDFSNFPSEIQERITFRIGNCYQEILNWIKEYKNLPPQPLDHYLVRIFGEVLSQPGFGFHDKFDKGQITENIIESIRNFRLSAGEVLELTNTQLGSKYYLMVKSGVLANQYPKSWTQRPEDAVYLTPAYTFLLSNIPSDYQFWLDVGSRGWYERIFQPLTNPHVLNRDWIEDRPWRDIEEFALNRQTLSRLATGLIRRCRKGIIFCLTNTDERGFEQKGILIQSLNKVNNYLHSVDKNQS